MKNLLRQHFQMDGISQAIAIRSIIRVCLPMAAHNGKEAGTDLTQNLPNGCADFPNNVVLEVSPRRSLGLLQTQAPG
jgi:hypothetical protein